MERIKSKLKIRLVCKKEILLILSMQQIEYYKSELSHLKDQCRQNREIGELQGLEKNAQKVFELEEELEILRKYKNENTR